MTDAEILDSWQKALQDAAFQIAAFRSAEGRGASPPCPSCGRPLITSLPRNVFAPDQDVCHLECGRCARAETLKRGNPAA